MREKDGSPYQKPQINLSRSTGGRMRLVCLCAGLAIIQSSLTDSFTSLVLVLLVVFSAVLTEFLILLKGRRQEELKDGSAIASALILSLLLPNQIPPLYAVTGAVFAMAVVKHSFGGLGANWVNPALGGWLFIRLSWPEPFEKALDNSLFSLLNTSLGDGLIAAHGSPLGILKTSAPPGFLAAGSPVDNALRDFLNNTIFSLTGTELPGAYIDLFISPLSGIIVDRGLGAFLLGTLLITAAQVNRVRISLVYLGVYVLLIRIFGALPYGGRLGEGDILFGLFSGGTMAAVFLLATDPVTGPKSNWGFLVVALLAGVFTYLFRYPGGEPYGAFFAILLVNTLIPLIRDCESSGFYSKRKTP
ncbi:MAG: RnfABCDGE type electron transport complex subunit D [Treponema sp.]|jgi:electron transport complex protein RnfD|nr:RnfABCDGE type electron transport complex subunit D [Treponema sp.]